jgi:hypothetical protein
MNRIALATPSVPTSKSVLIVCESFSIETFKKRFLLRFCHTDNATDFGQVSLAPQPRLFSFAFHSAVGIGGIRTFLPDWFGIFDKLRRINSHYCFFVLPISDSRQAKHRASQN